jgi:glucokinase-like ROK family protein
MGHQVNDPKECWMSNIKSSGPVALRRLNRGVVLDVLRAKRPISRTGLARQARLSKPTISVIVEQLLALNLAREIGLGSSQRGRRPVQLDFNPDAQLVVGAEYRGHDWSLVLTNLDGHVLRRLIVPTANTVPELVVDALAQGVHELCDPGELCQVLGVGVGVPGTVAMQTGVVALALNLGWSNVPLRQLMEKSLGLPFVVANRCKAAALAERAHGVGRDMDNLIYVRVGTGVGAGFVYRGELFLGRSYAGELGHCSIDPDGPLCRCGNRGCLEALASGPALAARAQKRLRDGDSSLLSDLCSGQVESITARMVAQAAQEGDTLARQILAETGTFLGIAIGALINLYNPQMVVLGGPVSQAGPFLIEPLREQVRRHSLSLLAQDVRLELSMLGNDAGPVGAATMVSGQLNDLLEWPEFHATAQ